MERRKSSNSNLLFDEEPLVVSRSLARILNLNKAVALQQIHYWCNKSKNFVNPNEHFIDGHWWIYNTYEEWQNQFCIGSERTVRRVLKELENEGLILVANHHKDKHNRTNWYAINHKKLDELYEKHNRRTGRSGQNDQVGGQNVKEVDKMTTCTSGQNVKEIDKVDTCISNTENTQRLPEITTNIDLFKEYTENLQLQLVLKLFNEMRSEMGKQLTEAATKLLLADLDSFTNSDEEKVLILRKSILNGWKEIFPLPQSVTKKDKNSNNAALRIEEEMKRRGEFNPEPTNPDDYHDWIKNLKDRLE